MNTTSNKYLIYLKSLMTILIPFSFFLIFANGITLADSSDSLLPYYIPKDNITIDCGSFGTNSALDGRIWIGDINTKFFPSQYQNNESITATADQKTIQVSSIPYQTARLSRFQFTYIIPVTPGQKFVRLHFYPASYGNFDSAKAFFSVKTARYTLLSNFSASLTAYALDRLAIVKEFCLNVGNDESGLFNITFFPVSSNSESFAFINGIEVLSMPTGLYYSAADNDGIKFVGQSEPFSVREETAMEMVYRINVGGSFISPPGDTGMFRTWETENDYLAVPGYSVLPLDITHNLSYKVIPPYTAPAGVYRTARSLGNKDRALIKSYNLTWEFPVDTRFNYLLRLHFCEIQHEINQTGDRVFLIFIANQTAEEDADVISWSGGQYIPVYKDYVVAMFGKGGEKKVNLSVALRANPEDWKSAYADAILNGVEIFKLSDNTGNLGGPNPDPSFPVTPPSQQQRNGQPITTAVVCGVASGVALLSVIGLCVWLPRRKFKIIRPSVDGNSGSISLSTIYHIND